VFATKAITGEWKGTVNLPLPSFWSNAKLTKKGDTMPPEYKYFKPEEVEGLNEEFCAKLDQARHLAGIPFKITSGLRTLEINKSIIGASPDSSHLQGLAVDLLVENSHEVYLIISSAISVGISRFGVYVNSGNVPTHVYLDMATDRASEVVWVKREGAA